MLLRTIKRKTIGGGIVISLLLAGFLIIYCNDSEINNSKAPMGDTKFLEIIDISYGDSVDIYDISPDSEHSVITFNITVYHGATTTGYKGGIQSLAPNFIDTGWIASLYNSSQTDTLWQYQFKWDLDDTSWVGIMEIADGDEFYLEFSESGANYIEAFIQDNDTLILTYDTSLLDGMRGDTAGYSQQDKDIMDSLIDEFDDFYDTTAAINNNDDGELLSYLLDSDDFWQLISDRVYPNGPPKGELYRDKEKEKICALATLGSLKCLPMLGGPVNPLCAPSLGTSIACAIATIWGWITGSD